MSKSHYKKINQLSPKQIFVGKCIASSFIFHICLALCLLIKRSDSPIIMRFGQHTHLPANIVVVPFAQHIPNAFSSLKSNQVSTPVPAPSPAKKNVVEGFEHTKKKRPLSKEQKNKSPEKKTNQTATSSKPDPKKDQKINKTASDSAKASTDTRPNPLILPGRHSLGDGGSERKESKEGFEHLKKASTQTEEKKQAVASQTTPDEPLYIGSSDLALLDAYEHIQEQLQETWKPPAGLNDDIFCKLRISLDKKGTIIEINIAQSSSVITYDLAARDAAMKLTYPKQFFGKECILTFG